MSANGIVKRRASGRIIEWLTHLIDAGDALERQHDGDRTFSRGQLAADLLAKFDIFVRRRSHQRDAGIVNVEFAASEVVRYGVARPEVDHVQRAYGNNL